jgi:hypothetical protein
MSNAAEGAHQQPGGISMSSLHAEVNAGFH